jgi:hypothetical protein
MGRLKIESVSVRFAHFDFVFRIWSEQARPELRPEPPARPSFVTFASLSYAPNKSPRKWRGHRFDLAERAGFEPAIPFRVYTLSRRAPSTTRTPLLIKTARNTHSHHPPRDRGKTAAGPTGPPESPPRGRREPRRRGRKNTQSPLTFRIIFPHLLSS